MLGQFATSAASSVDNRIFVYEVTGLHQNDRTDRQQSPIRSSENQFFQVPFHRMNEEMQRITMLGGSIVNISPLTHNAATSQPKQADTTADVAENTAE